MGQSLELGKVGFSRNFVAVGLGEAGGSLLQAGMAHLGQRVHSRRKTRTAADLLIRNGEWVIAKSQNKSPNTLVNLLIAILRTVFEQRHDRALIPESDLVWLEAVWAFYERDPNTHYYCRDCLCEIFAPI
jgi:hypothetical protein